MDNKITFKTEIEESLANAIRRYMNHIPIIAFDEIEISKNDSPLYDETIAHRIGLIPLEMDKSMDEKTEGHSKIDVKKEGFVYSEELKGKISPVYNNIPITLLDKGQELSLVASIKAGKGIEHSKFSPGLMFYRNIVDIKMDKDCPKEIIEACPKKVFKENNGKIAIDDSSRCDMCEACVEICKKKNKGNIELIPTKNLLITLESYGQLEVKDILKKAINILREDLVDLGKKISK